MQTVTSADLEGTMAVSVLDREMFTEAEAARLLTVPQATLNYWLEGGVRRGKLYRPVIRVEPRGDRDVVTWAEFIGAGLLRQYRRKWEVVSERVGNLIPLTDEIDERAQFSHRHAMLTSAGASCL